MSLYLLISSDSLRFELRLDSLPIRKMIDVQEFECFPTKYLHIVAGIGHDLGHALLGDPGHDPCHELHPSTMSGSMVVLSLFAFKIQNNKTHLAGSTFKVIKSQLGDRLGSNRITSKYSIQND